MRIYNYCPVTGEFLSIAEADESPLEPGVFMIPALATDVAPPKTGANVTVVFAAGKWSKVSDHRGEVWFDAQRNKHEISDLGVTPDALWIKELPVAERLSIAKAQALIAVDRFHAETVQQLAGNPAQVEKDSWAMKLATANAVLANATVSGEGVAFMTAAGFVAQPDQAAWAAKVLANAARYAGLVGTADALRSAARAAISAATSQTELDTAIATNKAAADAAIISAKAKLGIV